MRSIQDEEDTRKFPIYDIVQAYIAMGGGPGEDGHVERGKLEKVIAEEFEMTIDIKVKDNLHHVANAARHR